MRLRCQTEAMEPFSYAESIIVAASPESLYALVSDLSRTGEWSPICKACWWHDDQGPREGAWFSGRNEADGRVWETESQVAVAQPGPEFAWLVGGKFARWGFEFTPAPGGTQVTETWRFLPEGRAMFRKKYGPRAEAQISLRTEQARTGIPVTLAAIKRIAESSAPD
jgi:Polyketide cyclase / dehydrase and lipid transport